VNDRLIFGARSEPSLFEGLPKLAKTPVCVACIGVNRYDERRFRACGSAAV
jgi:hypothetical protein